MHHAEQYEHILLATSGVECAVVIQDVDELEIVLLARGEIVGVVRRCDLDGSCSEAHVHELRVCDDRHAASNNRMDQELAVECFVPDDNTLLLQVFMSTNKDIMCTEGLSVDRKKHIALELGSADSLRREYSVYVCIRCQVLTSVRDTLGRQGEQQQRYLPAWSQDVWSRLQSPRQSPPPCTPTPRTYRSRSSSPIRAQTASQASPK
jgi:hypothetical protein